MIVKRIKEKDQISDLKQRIKGNESKDKENNRNSRKSGGNIRSGTKENDHKWRLKCAMREKMKMKKKRNKK